MISWEPGRPRAILSGGELGGIISLDRVIFREGRGERADLSGGELENGK